MLSSELKQFGGAHHGAVFTHYLTTETCLGKAGKTAEVDSGLGMAGTDEDTALTSLKREHVAGTTEIDGLAGRIGNGTRRDATLHGGDARGGGDMVDADGEGSLVVVAVVGDHLRQVQPLAQHTAHGHADKSLGERCHEVDILCGGKLGRTDEVALVLAVGVVDNKDTFALAHGLKGFFYCIEFFVHSFLLRVVAVVQPHTLLFLVAVIQPHTERLTT